MAGQAPNRRVFVKKIIAQCLLPILRTCFILFYLNGRTDNFNMLQNRYIDGSRAVVL